MGQPEQKLVLKQADKQAFEMQEERGWKDYPLEVTAGGWKLWAHETKDLKRTVPLVQSQI